jgi:hypothetical protein
MHLAERDDYFASMWSLPIARRAIIAAGCFGMVFTQLTASPATVKFAHQLGAGGWHVGILGALPQAMLVFQFLAALAANHLRYRRRTWLCVSLVQRTVLLPIAIGPWLLPDVPTEVWLWGLIAATAADHAMLQFCSPLWLSWMGDYLPRDGLTRFWGMRQVWMQWAAAAALLACAILLCKTGWDARWAYSVIIVIASTCGVIDLLFFLNVHEPPVAHTSRPPIREVLVAPFRHGDFRRFISYSSFWHFAAMLGAPFISMYLLVDVGMGLYDVLLLWATSWVGGALLSRRMGHWTEEYGNRPMLVLCTAIKSLIMIALVFTPRDPTLVFWVMVPVFTIDAATNAGIAIATNGFLLKHSPSENRATYIAAGTAVAGIVGGVTSIAAGGALSLLGPSRVEMLGLSFSGFHAVFFASILMRVASIFYARRIREPQAQGAKHVVAVLIGASPLRLIRFPLGLHDALEEEAQKEPARRAA